jgi:hypothetical protein
VEGKRYEQVVIAQDALGVLENQQTTETASFEQLESLR